MMAHDVLRVVRGELQEETLKAVDVFVHGMINQFDALQTEGDEIKEMWRKWKEEVLTKDKSELELRSRELMERLGDVVMGTLLVLDAGRSRDGVAKDVLHAWIASRGHGGSDTDWREIVEREKRVVFGLEGPEGARAML